tara:strand:- start:288 stop:686 length:399 start_codon:yes stop_codon:yes gene_type:complete
LISTFSRALRSEYFFNGVNALVLGGASPTLRANAPPSSGSIARIGAGAGTGVGPIALGRLTSSITRRLVTVVSIGVSSTVSVLVVLVVFVSVTVVPSAIVLDRRSTTSSIDGGMVRSRPRRDLSLTDVRARE